MKTSHKWIFGLSGIGKDAMYAMSTLMSIYLINYVGMGPLFIGLMFMVVRVWDAINDPIMGGIVENVNMKFGKFRPWILLGTLLNSIIVVTLFINPGFEVSSIGFKIYITASYTLWGMSYTLMDIPFWSMIPALSDDQKVREELASLTRFFTTIGFAIVSAMYLPLVGLLGAGSFDTTGLSNSIIRSGFLWLSIVVAIVFLGSQFIMVMIVKERDLPRDSEKISISGMFKLLKDNDQLMIVMIVVVITNFVMYITSNMAFYYVTYDIGNQNLLFPFLAFGALFQLLGIGTYTLLSKQLSRKKLYNLSILVQVIAFLILFINGFLLNNNIIILFAVAAFVFYGLGLGMVLTTVLLSDTVEYGELKTGRRSEAIVFSVQTFVVKLATGLSMAVVGGGLALFGFVSSEDELLVQSDTTIFGIRLLMFVLPIIGMLLSRYIFNKFHKIDEDYYSEIVAKLQLERETM
jgi:melibiose permease